LDKKAAAASAALVEKLREAAAKKAATALKKETEASEKAAAKEAEKAEKALKKATEKAEKAAEKAAAKEAEKAEKALKKAADAALKESTPKRPVGRPSKKATGGAGSSSTTSTVDDMLEAIPAITPAMRKRIFASDSVDLETHPTLFSSPESQSPEELIAENARLRTHLAAISEAYSRQKAIIAGSMELLSAASH
jgi:hypothetical protein